MHYPLMIGPIRPALMSDSPEKASADRLLGARENTPLGTSLVMAISSSTPAGAAIAVKAPKSLLNAATTASPA